MGTDIYRNLQHEFNSVAGELGGNEKTCGAGDLVRVAEIEFCEINLYHGSALGGVFYVERAGCFPENPKKKGKGFRKGSRHVQGAEEDRSDLKKRGKFGVKTGGGTYRNSKMILNIARTKESNCAARKKAIGEGKNFRKERKRCEGMEESWGSGEKTHVKKEGLTRHFYETGRDDPLLPGALGEISIKSCFEGRKGVKRG